MRDENQHDELTEMLNRLDIEDYLDGAGVEYRHTHGSSGPQLNLYECPVCGNAKWKVFIGVDSGLGNCFSGSCEKKFNKFSLIQAVTGLSGKGVVEHIKQRVIEMGWRPPRKRVSTQRKTDATLKMPHSYPIPIEGRNLAYLENRGIDVATCRYFDLSFCHRGLFPYSQNGRQMYMDFSRRIMIPIFDLDGNMVSFQGRDITGAAEKKYLFPPGFASTGEVLFNGQNVINAERVVVGEGVFDVAAIKIALDGEESLRDVVPIGSFGKNISFGHERSQLARFIDLQSRGVKEVTIMWDGELKATDDAIRAGEMLKGIGMGVRIAALPFEKDPNEILASEVRRVFWEAIPLTNANAVKLRLMRR
jgi:DNA primase